MLWKVYSLYDVSAAVFMPPFCVRAEVEAVRSVVAACENKQTPIAQYPSEFVLMELGRFDDGTGQMETYSAHNSLGPVSGLLVRK